MFMANLAESFDQYFRVIIAHKPGLKSESFRIRHAVYCKELNWEPLQSDEMETDEFDEQAIALLIQHRSSGQFAGTVRLLVPNNVTQSGKLPFELHWQNNEDDEQSKHIPENIHAYGEVSRLAVPAMFRRRKNEANKPYIISRNSHLALIDEAEKRQFPNIAIGLYLGTIALAKALDVDHIFVAIEVRLQQRLRRLGLNFKLCGSPIDINGMRGLFVMPTNSLKETLAPDMECLNALIEKDIYHQVQAFDLSFNGTQS